MKYFAYSNTYISTFFILYPMTTHFKSFYKSSNFLFIFNKFLQVFKFVLNFLEPFSKQNKQKQKFIK